MSILSCLSILVPCAKRLQSARALIHKDTVRMFTPKKAAMTLALLLLVSGHHPADAEIYEWTDDTGAVVFSDDPAKVPKNLRKAAKRPNGELPGPSWVMILDNRSGYIYTSFAFYDESKMNLNKAKIAIILFYLALFAGLALYDEKPDPELAREMARPLPEVLEPGNAWVAFLGFGAPEGVSLCASGEKTLRKLNDAISAGKSFAECYPAIADSTSRLSFRGTIPSLPVKKDSGMLPYATAHKDEIAVLIRDNRELLRRYETLRTFPRYAEYIDQGFYAPIPSFAPLRSAQRLKLLQLAVAANRGDLAPALAGLREDMDFWRFVSRSSATLISKLIAIACLQNDLRFAAELGASRRLNAGELSAVQEILRPFEEGEATLTGALRGEARYMQRGMVLTSWQKTKKWQPENLFFKRNATTNRMYADCQEIIRLAALTPQKFAVETKRRDTETARSHRIGPPFLYNSVGEILAIIGMPASSGYIEKGHNLEGLRRLACLKVLACRGSIPRERLQQFLDAHARDLGNPYTGGPMTWDSKTGAISFKPLSGENVVEIFL
jgi:hypothetical protein